MQPSTRPPGSSGKPPPPTPSKSKDGSTKRPPPSYGPGTDINPPPWSSTTVPSTGKIGTTSKGATTTQPTSGGREITVTSSSGAKQFTVGFPGPPSQFSSGPMVTELQVQGQVVQRISTPTPMDQQQMAEALRRAKAIQILVSLLPKMLDGH